MNSGYDYVASVAQRASRYNLDDLIQVMVKWNEPNEIRRDLLMIYFHAANAVFNNGESAGTELANAFTTLQELIEALSTVSDTNAARLAVTIK